MVHIATTHLEWQGLVDVCPPLCQSFHCLHITRPDSVQQGCDRETGCIGVSSSFQQYIYSLLNCEASLTDEFQRKDEKLNR